MGCFHKITLTCKVAPGIEDSEYVIMYEGNRFEVLKDKVQNIRSHVPEDGSGVSWFGDVEASINHHLDKRIETDDEIIQEFSNWMKFPTVYGSLAVPAPMDFKYTNCDFYE